ncbi:glycosyltransferase family 4 protein [Pseudaminobacter sp. NGMCC 1.201702]|uniref:glycosyltransferase family 4 protein n=1 Tax=Pseudaminobacter sp. NGMCC 1.201702 TaxID=3391825 RepID=UPI0039EF1A92
MIFEGSAGQTRAHSIRYRVAFVISSLGGGGAERVVIDLCSELAERGHEITLITLNGSDPDKYELGPQVNRIRLEIRSEGPGMIARSLAFIRRLYVIRKGILSQRPDIVVSFIDKTNVFVLAALIGTNVPTIVSERTHPGQSPLPRNWAIFRRILYRRASALVVQTRSIADWCAHNFVVSRLVVIPNAIRRSLSAPSATIRKPGDAKRTIVAAGRLTHEKGFDLLLAAFAKSGLARCEWQLVIAGDGDLGTVLRSQAAELGIADAVRFPGHVTEIYALIVNADLFVLSSRYEGFPNALIEAMQLGRPCISFDCPSGPAELIDDNQNGILVSPNNVEAFSRALIELADDPERRQALGQAASRSVCAKFSRKSVYDHWAALIEETVRHRVPRTPSRTSVQADQ